MHKLFLHLLIACTTFFFSLFLTKVSNILWSVDSSIEVVEGRSQCDQRYLRDKQQLLEIYREYGPAQTRHDRAFFERVETEDFVLFLEGETLSREEDIQLMEKLPADIVYKADVENLQMLGDAAVVTGRMTASHPTYNYSWPWIDVWVRRGDQWQIQSTTSVR